MVFSMGTKPQTLDAGAAETVGSPARKMLIGAEAIARFLYGKDDDKAVRDVYRNIAGLTFFHHGNSLAAFTDTLLSELRQHEREAREELQRKKDAEARKIVKPHRRRARHSHQEVVATPEEGR
jgi:hypothetical protein